MGKVPIDFSEPWTLYFPLFPVLAPFQFFCKDYITWNLIILHGNKRFLSYFCKVRGSLPWFLLGLFM